MRAKQFKPQAYLCITNVCYLGICIEDDYVYSAFFDNEGKKQSDVVKSLLRFHPRKMAAYFFKHRDRYFLSEFTKTKIVD